MLLHFENVAGSKTFLDADFWRYMDRSGPPSPEIDTNRSKFGGSSSRFFGGPSCFLECPVTVPGGPSLHLGANDFTLQCFLYVESVPTASAHLMGCWNGYGGLSYYLFIISGGYLGFGFSTTGSYQAENDAAASTSPVTAGEWIHVAAVRNGDTFTIYKNGVAIYTRSMSGITIAPAGSIFSIGGNQASQGFVGWIDELRVQIGIAAYTGNFTPPASPFLPADEPLSAKSFDDFNRSSGNSLPQSPINAVGLGEVFQWETQTTGSGTISGVVTIENIPGSRKVRLYRKHDGMLIRETWSAPNGAYSFSNLDPAWEYFVVTHDHLRVYNGVIQDMLTP